MNFVKNQAENGCGRRRDRVRGEGAVELRPLVDRDGLEARGRRFRTSSRKATGSLCPGAQLIGRLMR